MSGVNEWSERVRDDEQPKLKIRLDWVIVDVIGALLTGLGLAGLMGGGEAIVPLLADRGIAMACVVIGVALMGVALIQILRHMRESARRR